MYNSAVPPVKREPSGGSTTAQAIAGAVNAGELHPAEAVERALRALESRAELNAAITVCAEEALARARNGVSGPLAGVPLLVKDVFDTAGVRTTAGSRIYAERVPNATAPVVAALEAAGAIVVAKTGCDEFAWGVTGQNHFYGDTRNPVHPGRITGGSSSGNAAALAAAIAPLAVGSDTGGSVRMPAAGCEVVGFKPAHGVLSTAGMFPLCPSFDAPGPMARTVTDCALAYEVLTGAPLGGRDPHRLRVGVLTAMPRVRPEEPAPHDDRAVAFAARLERLGMRCEEVVLPAPEVDLWPIFFREAALSHRATFPARREEYGPTIRAKLDRAQHVEDRKVATAREGLARWRDRAGAEPDVDVLVSPTLGVRELPPSDVDELHVRVAFSAYTRVFNFLGWPAIAIGGAQFAGRDASLVFAAALAWEGAAG